MPALLSHAAPTQQHTWPPPPWEDSWVVTPLRVLHTWSLAQPCPVPLATLLGEWWGRSDAPVAPSSASRQHPPHRARSSPSTWASPAPAGCPSSHTHSPAREQSPSAAHLLAGRKRRHGAGGGSWLRVIFILQHFIQVPYGLLFLLHGRPGSGAQRGPHKAPGKGLTRLSCPSLTQLWTPATSAG